MGAVLRAMSPLHFANTVSTDAITRDPDSAMDDDSRYAVSDAASARHASLQAANSVGEVIAMVPAHFRQILRPQLELVASKFTQLEAARSHLAKWEAHSAAGTFPSWCSIQAPAVQFTKGFEESEEGRAFRSTLTSGHLAYQKQLLAAYLDSKRKEIAQLERETQPDSLLGLVQPIVQERYKALKDAVRVPETKTDEQGNITIVRWIQSPLPFELCRQVLQDWVVYSDRIRAIIGGAALAAEHKKAAKKRVQRAAEVEMAEAGPSGSSIQSAVDRAVNAAVKRITSKETEVSSNSHTGCLKLTHCLIKDSPFSPPQQRPKQWQSESGSQIRSDHHRWSHASSCSRRRQEQEEGPSTLEHAPSIPYPNRSEKERKGQGWRKRERQSSVDCGVPPLVDVVHSIAMCDICLDAKMASYDYPKYETLPDEICEISYTQAIPAIIRHIPLEFIEAARYRSRVHTGPGVSLPFHLEHDLSIGMKHMFHQPRSAKLITDAYLDFVRRLRWKIKFTIDGENTTYDPDYDVREPSKKKPPVLPFYCELALKRGRAYIHNVTANVPSDGLADDSFKPLGPKVNELRKFMLDNDYVVTATDKNLGLAVSERTWIIKNTLACLSNEKDYKQLSEIEAQQILDRKCNEMLLLAQASENYCWKYGSLDEYLKHLITPPNEKHHIPRFYGIPKIHKLPVKFRPILPCHSAIQNPAAKFCSKMLKPLVEEALTVIHGTKDLAIKLSKLQLNPGSKYYIVTGDVVAYYPNVPLAKCLDRISGMFTDWLLRNESDIHRNWNGLSIDAFLKLFNDALRVGNTELLTQFDGKVYLQLNGLAMGVADSPDLANLYGWFCEKRDGVLHDPRIAFYGRYIDDCLGIVYAGNPQEALAILRSRVTIDDCEITWDVGNAQPFLDMLLYVDNRGKLQHRPYQKAKSLHQRIPWVSAHPMDVKRGTFYGEMSRLATLSSTFDNYLDAMDWLVTIYVQRGYDKALCNFWKKEKLIERWENRLSQAKEEHDAVLVLKSEFNTAWEFLNVTALGDTILGYMRSWLYRAERMEFSHEFPPEPVGYETDCDPMSRFSMETVRADGSRYYVPDLRRTDILDRRLLVSRKRTQQLSDIVSLWKKIVLEQHTDKESGDTDTIHPLDQPSLVGPPSPGPSIPARYRRLRSGRLIDLDNDEYSVQRRSVSPIWVDDARDLLAETYLRVSRN